MSEKESFSFDKGINRKKSTILLEEGELYSASGFSYERDGILETRTAKTTKTAIAASINGIHRYGSNMYAAAGGSIYRATVGGAYSAIDSVSGRPRFCDYEKFTFMVDGTNKRAYVDGYDYEFGVNNPSTVPTLADGAAGNPNGTYDCYVTFYVTFTNGKIVETGPSTVASITTAGANKIEWTAIPVSTFSGTVTSIQRRLWRTVLGIAYLVTTLANNTATTYSDNIADATLQVSEALPTIDYSIPPSSPVDIAMHLQRIFLIAGTSIYWSEPYKPFSFDINGNGVVSKDNENLVALKSWGDQLYIASAQEWYRLNGSDPATWQVKRTFTDSGVSNRHTLVKSKFGLIGKWYDGIYVFDGNMNKNVTDKKIGKQFFKTITDASCFAEFDGIKYYFYYPSNCLVLDFSYYPDIRFYHDDFVAEAHEFYRDTGTNYFAKSGYEYQESGSETIVTSFISADKPFGNILKRKCLKYLYYEIDTGGEDVTITIYVDGTLGQTLTLNTDSRVRKRSDQLKQLEGYMFQIRYSCADSTGVEIYAPWALEADLVGE